MGAGGSPFPRCLWSTSQATPRSGRAIQILLSGLSINSLLGSSLEVNSLGCSWCLERSSDSSGRKTFDGRGRQECWRKAYRDVLVKVSRLQLYLRQFQVIIVYNSISVGVCSPSAILFRSSYRSWGGKQSDTHHRNSVPGQPVENGYPKEI